MPLSFITRQTLFPVYSSMKMNHFLQTKNVSLQVWSIDIVYIILLYKILILSQQRNLSNQSLLVSLCFHISVSVSIREILRFLINWNIMNLFGLFHDFMIYFPFLWYTIYIYIYMILVLVLLVLLWTYKFKCIYDPRKLH